MTPRASGPASEAPSAFARIEAWEDARSLGDGQLVALATSSPDARVRARAQLALARVQDAGTAGAVARGLGDADPDVRAMAAFAAATLGQSWDPLPEEPKRLLISRLVELEPAEQVPGVRERQLTALGRLRAPEAMGHLVLWLVAPEPEVRAQAARSIGLLERAGERAPEPAVATLAALFKDPRVEVRLGAAYALASSVGPASRPPLLECLGDESPLVRRLCAQGLGAVGLPEDAIRLGALLDSGEYREAVEATRSLARLAEKCPVGSCPPVEVLGKLNGRVTALEESREGVHAPVLLALAQHGLPVQGAPLLEQLRARLQSALRHAPSEQAHDFANLDCRFAAALDRIAGALVNSLSCGDGSVPESRRLATALHELARGPAFAQGGHFEPVIRLLDHREPAVRAAAVEALGHARVTAAAEAIRALVRDPDPVLAAAAATAAGELGDAEAVDAVRALSLQVPGTPELAEPVAEALVALKAPNVAALLQGWLTARHPHVRNTAAKALTRLTGAPVHAVAGRSFAREPEPPAPEGATLTLRTDKGDVLVKLDTSLTPRTSANLYRLARQGYFDGLTFHRVVPAFVAQGGDPRGDGEGGPGYTIRCEASPRAYVRGTVGMALSGKDTGGSQFFITTSDTPHLDGRYTAFGEVVSGMDAVELLLEGDLLREVRASP